MVIESSQLLYELTKQRAFFRNVSIVLPSSWSTKTEYRNVTDHDFYSSATVRVGPPNPKYDDTPYTLQPGDCGEVGRYIHFTPEFLMKYCILPEMGLPTKRINRNANNVICKKITKIFVNQWLRFKYGVFPEHGIVNSHQFPMFYVGDDTKVSWLRSHSTVIC